MVEAAVTQAVLPSDWLALPSGCGLGWFLSAAAVAPCVCLSSPQHFHGDWSVSGLILRSVREWRRMRRNRTLNTVRRLACSCFPSARRRNGNNDCRRCAGCGPHGRHALGHPSLSSSYYRSCHTFCTFFVFFSPGRAVSLTSFSMKIEKKLKNRSIFSIKNPNQRTGCV